ncbi:TetR/AcrR family transcriptional regulator [Brevibacillus composti]|uniref:TetR/AcrR family transcriptional regulator n=1 Tax=Brevibacillus composti TaxID=2796470 RepID=A0A7T5EPT4_9BACL|nr:TetR/AcrR family transcriptional regulator [Brevibacillus composti]QQE76549.1 TetR/AcrR family transcriptional regulator [Brevibacillus composti]QUO43622.1 TetR/AcrR family transcriptional regulator [Brevibacillus composti]
MRSQQTRQKLLEAAKEVFQEEGFHKATISQIIKRAKTGYGTAYVHFTGKDDLLIVLMEDVMASFYSIAELPFTPATREEAEQLIQHQTLSFLQLAESEHQMLQVLGEAIGVSLSAQAKWTEIRERFISRIAQDIGYSQSRKLARGALDAELVARGWFYSHEMYLWDIVHRRHQSTLEEIAKTLTAIYTGGLYA